MMTPVDAEADRPEFTIFWQPGCSSCLKAKDFLEEHGFSYESVNVLDRPDAMKEIEAAGLRSIPVVRRGSQYIYAQSVDDIAELLGVSSPRVRLTQSDLLARWNDILEAGESIVMQFSEDVLRRRVIAARPGTVADLSAHAFQVVESFLRQVEDDSIDARAIYLAVREDIESRRDLLSYIRATREQYRSFMHRASERALPSRLRTHYGDQPVRVVLERGVWHSAQHVRQLDVVSAGMGAELSVDQHLLEGLPMPKRLWG